MCNTIWLVNSTLSFYLVNFHGEFLIVKNSGVRKELSTNHGAITRVCACAPHLWFVHLPNWYFSLHLTPLKRPGIRAVDNFKQFIFGSLPTSSHKSASTQERVKQESTFRFIFILQTIYDISKGVDLPPIMTKSSLSISYAHYLELSLASARPPNNWSIE